MKISNNGLFFIVLFFSFYGSAYADVDLTNVSFDYRHEYRVRDRTHFDRLLFSTTLPANYSFSADVKFKTGGSNPVDKYYQDEVLNAVEMTLAKTYQVGNWKIIPLIQPEFNSSRTEWKFGVSPWYTINEHWSIGGLYRLELTDYAHDSVCDTVGVVCTTNRHRTVNRVDGYFSYSQDDWQLVYKIIYQHGDEDLFANKHYNYEQELQFNYFMGDKKEWSPYITFGDINRSSISSERQLRLRVGVVYAFK